MKPSIPIPTSGSSPFYGPGLSRRGFVALGGSGIVASWFLRSPAAALAATSAQVTPRNTAKNCIFISLGGAPSHVDTFDLKEGAWTPPAFQPTSYLNGAVRFPRGLMPKIAGHLGDVVLLRSCGAWALVHSLAQTWTEIARNPTSTLGPVSPHIGAVVALEIEARRNPTDLLPSFMALNAPGHIGSGYFPAKYGPFALSPAPGGIDVVGHPDGIQRFQGRWNDLMSVDLGYRSGPSPLGKAATDFAGFYEQAKVLVETPDIGALFSFTDSDVEPYGATGFGASCLVAKRVLAAHRGTRFIQLEHGGGGWDHHSNIYLPDAGIFAMCRDLDPAVSTLITQMKATPGEAPGKSLFDETLIVMMGEFGRTTGPLNNNQGRDHGFRYTTLMAGGGVRGGRVIGRTDATGDGLVEAGWSANRSIRPEDTAATIYSALGIDWTTIRRDDPFGRGFEYIPYASQGTYKPIDEVFG